MSFRLNGNLADQIGLRLDRTFEACQPVPPAEILMALFTLDGLGVDPDMNVDGSITGKEFRYVVPAGKTAIVHSIGFHLLDTSIDFNGFGALGALGNGVRILIHDADDNVLVHLVDGFPITHLGEFTHFGTPRIYVDRATGGAVEDMFNVTVPFCDICGYVPFLTEGQYIEIHIDDNLTGLTHFEATLGGRLIDAS